MTLPGTTAAGQCGPGSNGHDGVLYISQIFMGGDCLVSYQDTH